MELTIFVCIFSAMATILIAILHRIEQANSLANRRLVAIEAAGDGIGIVDRRGNLIYMNRALMELHEIKDSASYIGKSWSNLYTDKGREQIDNIVMPYLLEHNTWRGESPIVTTSGQVVYAEMFLTRLPDGGFIGTARDITKRKQDEAEKEALQKKFVQAQKMEIVGALSGGIAHDFNNMLTVISGNLEILEDEANVEGQAQKSLQAMKRAISHGAALTQRLLAFSRQQVLAPTSVNLNDIIPETISMMKRTLGEQIEIIFRPHTNLPKTMIDTGQIENALLNLSINARDAMPKGGTITITTKTENVPNGHAYITPGEYVCICVADTGHGIPEDLLPRVFDPFFTTKEVGQGSGLGLSMVYGFTKQSGGYVTIDSEVGRGTTICLYFPQSEQGVFIEPEHDAAPQSAVKGEGHILIVEDQADVLDFTERMLKKLGYQVQTARNGAEAVMMLDTIGHIDLLMTDMVMPGGINGKELAEEARSKFPDLRILYVSGYSGEDLKEELSSHYADFLPKPYQSDKLSAKIHKLLSEA